MSRRRSKREDPKVDVEAVTVESQVPPKQKQAQELFTQRMNACTHLIIKVAACKCPNKDTCPVYLKAQEIAEVIDRLQELRAKGVIGG